jgi:hypothetical protein
MNLYAARVLLPTGVKVWWMWDANRRIEGGPTDTLYDLLYRWRGECGPHSNVVVKFDGHLGRAEAEAAVAASRPLPKISIARVTP